MPNSSNFKDKRIKYLSLMLLFIIAKNVNAQDVCLKDLEVKDSVWYYHNIIYSGYYHCYDDKGVLRSRGVIKEGLRDSIADFFDKKGRLTERVWFKNNREIKRQVNRKALLSRKVIDLKDNVKDGLWEKYYANGKLSEQRYYKLGKPTGKWTTWDKRGNVVTETDYSSNPVVQKEYTTTDIKIIYIDKNSGKVLKKEKIKKATVYKQS